MHLTQLAKTFLLNEITLKEIEEEINPSHFFSINRSELINKQQIEKIGRYDKNTLAVKIKSPQFFSYKKPNILIE